MTDPQTMPTLNHVAITLPRDVLDDDGRKLLLGFFGEVFGWTEGDNTGEEGNPLILYTGPFGQFVYLLPGDVPLTAPHLDHFGFQVQTLVELQGIVDRAKAYREKDDRVDIIDVHSRVMPGPNRKYVLTSAYIGFVLPLMIELQHLGRIDES
jgi:hypothetical protein